jgi:tripartite-type tricarboxylate transporter receptor subunit TctC
MKRREHLAGLGAMLLGALAPAGAQTPYPNKPLRLLVGFPPGQATDTVARLLGERLAQKLGRPVIVENRPGQGGSAVLSYLKQLPPDGYSFTLAATGAVITNQYLQKNLPYRVSDFAPVGLVGDLPLMLVARPALPFNDLKGMVAYAKANAGKLSYASPGNGTTSHLTMESLKKDAGLDIVHIPYQGSVRALSDMMGGVVDVAFDTVAVTQPHIESKQIKLLAVGHSRRLAQFPSAPTVAESGFPDIIASVWLGGFVQAQVPPAVLQRLSDAFGQIVQEPAVNKRLEDLGLIVRSLDSDAFARMLVDEGPRWKRIVQISGAQVD